MKTFISWLIANIEIAITIVFIILAWTAIALMPGTESSVKLFVAFMIFIPTIALAGASTKELAGSVMLAIIFLIWNILLACYLGNTDSYIYVRYAIIALLALDSFAIPASIAIGIYTALNIGEVVSKSLKFRKSNVDIFTIKLTYSTNRALVTFAYINWISIFVVIYFMAISGHINELISYINLL